MTFCYLFTGGNAVLSLTKSHQYLNYTDTQASTIAALGNAALVLGGKKKPENQISFIYNIAKSENDQKYYFFCHSNLL